MYYIERDEDEINEVLNKCDEQEEKGGTKWPAMTYEQGVANAIRWIIGDWNDNPMED